MMISQKQLRTGCLNVYHEQTQPLIDYYSKKGVLAEVDGTQSMENVFNAIVDVLGK